MKTGEPIYPITNNRGCGFAELHKLPHGKAGVNFTHREDILTIADLEGIIDLMKKAELDWCAEPQPRDRE